MYTTDFKELTRLYSDKIADVEHFEDVLVMEDKIYKEMTRDMLGSKEKDNAMSLLAEGESAFELQGFIRGYLLATENMCKRGAEI